MFRQPQDHKRAPMVACHSRVLGMLLAGAQKCCSPELFAAHIRAPIFRQLSVGCELLFMGQICGRTSDGECLPSPGPQQHYHQSNDDTVSDNHDTLTRYAWKRLKIGMIGFITSKDSNMTRTRLRNGRGEDFDEAPLAVYDRELE